MKDYQKSFLNLALESKSLQFGEFTLKSGRISPYFFNAANMLGGCNLSELAKCYVDAIKDKGINFVIQPGGSIKDKEVIEACNEYFISMAFTGVRCFKH